MTVILQDDTVPPAPTDAVPAPDTESRFWRPTP